jgi:hypothetical protein
MGFCGAGFSLWVFASTRTIVKVSKRAAGLMVVVREIWEKGRRLKPALLGANDEQWNSSGLGLGWG